MKCFRIRECWRLPLSLTLALMAAAGTLGCQGAAGGGDENESDDASDDDSGGAGGSATGGAGTGGGGGKANAGGRGGGAGGSAQAGAGGSQGGVAGSASGGSAGGAAGSPAGGAGGATQVACATGNVCDGFEQLAASGGLGAWTKNGTGGTAKGDTTHVFAGAQAVQLTINAGANQRLQLQRSGAPLFPATGNVFWGRAMIWANQLPGKSNTEDKNVHYDIIQATGPGNAEYRIGGMGNILLNYEPHDCYFGANTPIPQNRWACWEWLFDGSKNTIEFYIDGQLRARVAGKGQGCVDGTDSVWAAPTFNTLRIGWVNYQSKADPTTLWLDEFAAGPMRIGCPQATAATH